MISNLAGIVETITGYLQSLTQQGYLTLDYIFYIGLGIELVLVIFFLIKSSFSYELRLDRTLNKLNRWLYYNQNIDENNLIAFNLRMKKAPKLLKYHWQQYMLYREHDPSHYMSNYNCIDKPLHTSSFTSNIKNLMSICWGLAFLTFALGLTNFALTGTANVGAVLLDAVLTPLAIIILATFFSILLRSWQNSNLAGLYQNFHLFNRYIDKACTSLPEYIDFEVLFTKKEISRGIPVLNEYLEKRARQEQKELENAMLNTVEHEEYNFDELGIDGSQILDRAKRETEIFLNQRQRSLSEIQQLESEIESLKRNYENNQKDYQRKMQASKENVDRLRKQQEESTNRIESNYIRKQQSDEIKKQEQLEKDYESTTLRFNQEYSSISAEIDARRAELQERHNLVEDAMKAEYKTFSGKLYELINQSIEEKNNEEKDKLISEKEEYANQLQENQVILESKQAEIDKLYQILNHYNISVGDHGEFYDENLRQAELDIKLGKKSFNTNENPEETTIEEDTPLNSFESFDENAEDVISEQQEPVIISEINEEPQEEIIQEQADTQEEILSNQIPKDAEEQPQEPVYDEYGGYYDSEGYYRYQNGTYYDPEGNYFDEFGGHFDKDGNYFPPENQNDQQEQISEDLNKESTTEQELVEEQSQEPVYDEYGGYYDSEGYYRYQNGTYYDPEGNYFDEFGGHYDKDGNYFPPENQDTETTIIEESEDENQPLEQSQDESEQIQELTEDEISQDEEEIQVDNQEQNEGKPKGKRGRPRKVETEPVEEKPKGKRGRPRKIETEPVEEKPKGKRGRPKKEVSQEDEQPKSPAKRGRPKKVVNEEPVEVQQKTAKRGRPKKVETQDEQEQLKSTTPIKRGRPRKEVTEQKPKVISKRGKPAKRTTQKPEEVVETEEKKKRGRPKKTNVSNEELFDELEKLNIQIQQENEKLQRQQAELHQKLDETLLKMDNDSDTNNNNA